MLTSSNQILQEDLNLIFNNFEKKKNFYNSTIVITGCAGFLGYYFSCFFLKFAEKLKLKKLIIIDKFPNGRPNWLKRNINQKFLIVKKIDVSSENFAKSNILKNIDYIVHAATNASPVLYRKQPLETLNANIIGLKNIFQSMFLNKNKIKGILFFSSSEIYGDPLNNNIPTDEEYNGNVSPLGPRACYNESKRMGETLCWIFANKYKIPIIIVRPFNNYGPGMKLNDGRLPADLASAILKNKDIKIFSNGLPTRTYCYISDAITGYLKCLVYGEFNYFNIGSDKLEISVKKFSRIFIKIGRQYFNFKRGISFQKSKDKNYLEHNPNRRCPNINKAKKLLKYSPIIDIHIGVERFLKFLATNNDY